MPISFKILVNSFTISLEPSKTNGIEYSLLRANGKYFLLRPRIFICSIELISFKKKPLFWKFLGIFFSNNSKISDKDLLKIIELFLNLILG